jgi:hypothetical protein
MKIIIVLLGLQNPFSMMICKLIIIFKSLLVNLIICSFMYSREFQNNEYLLCLFNGGSPQICTSASNIYNLNAPVIQVTN